MSLLAFQTALGRFVRGSDDVCDLDLAPDERARLDHLVGSPGFRFTVSVQRSWCEGRAASAARLTLSLLAPEERRRLVREWVSAGGGTATFVSGEADAFLEFIARRLPARSHAHTVARLEQAVYRVSAWAPAFVPPDLSALGDPDAVVSTGRRGAVVRLFADPRTLLAALNGAEPLPPLSEPPICVLFAPGLRQLFRSATPEEVELWEDLGVAVTMQTLSTGSHARKTIETLVAIGALDVQLAKRDLEL